MLVYDHWIKLLCYLQLILNIYRENNLLKYSFNLAVDFQGYNLHCVSAIAEWCLAVCNVLFILRYTFGNESRVV